MVSLNLLGILFGLTSALVWGSGDFSGGMATRRHSQFHVLTLSSLSGIIILLALALVWRETVPAWRDILWAAMAGASGALGLAALYRALSLGHTATVAPTAAVVSAALPVSFNLLVANWPTETQLMGFTLALPGIWFVSRTPTEGKLSEPALGLAFLAGIGFGGFFILIAQVEAGAVFAPLVVARFVSLGAALLLLFFRGLPIPSLTSNPVALLAGVLDAGGNVFYLLAQQFTRLDVAAVLSSFYPVSTMLLAYLILGEKISLSQWIGAALCLGAVALIAV